MIQQAGCRLSWAGLKEGELSEEGSGLEKTRKNSNIEDQERDTTLLAKQLYKRRVQSERVNLDLDPSTETGLRQRDGRQARNHG